MTSNAIKRIINKDIKSIQNKKINDMGIYIYFNEHNIDIRGIRYPGLISWKHKPSGGTTDYAVEMYFDAIEKGE